MLNEKNCLLNFHNNRFISFQSFKKEHERSSSIVFSLLKESYITYTFFQTNKPFFFALFKTEPLKFNIVCFCRRYDSFIEKVKKVTNHTQHRCRFSSR